MQARGAERHRDHRDGHRKPAELQGEDELREELAAVGIRRPRRRDEGLAGEDDHAPHPLEEGLRGQEGAVGRSSDHRLSPLLGCRRQRRALGASGGNLDPPPASDGAERPEPRHGPHLATAGVATFLVAHSLPAMGFRVADDPLAPASRPGLALAQPLRFAAGLCEPLDQFVAGRGKLGEVGQVALRAQEGMRLAFRSRLRICGELGLEARDLPAELAASGCLVSFSAYVGRFVLRSERVVVRPSCCVNRPGDVAGRDPGAPALRRRRPRRSARPRSMRPRPRPRTCRGRVGSRSGHPPRAGRRSRGRCSR